jgi:hypothetical protein
MFGCLPTNQTVISLLCGKLEKGIIKTGSLYPRFTKKENKISYVDYTA